MPVSGKSNLVDIAGELRHETIKAILWFDGTRTVWLPKSQVEVNDDDTVTMPEWLAVVKGVGVMRIDVVSREVNARHVVPRGAPLIGTWDVDPHDDSLIYRIGSLYVGEVFFSEGSGGWIAWATTARDGETIDTFIDQETAKAAVEKAVEIALGASR
jgi:hypothetical protein